MRQSFEFLCPECEGRQFSSSEQPRGWVGRCRSCGHEWDRDQDYVYFVVLHRFTSPGEYRRYMNGTTRRVRAVTIAALVLALFASGYSLVCNFLEGL